MTTRRGFIKGLAALALTPTATKVLKFAPAPVRNFVTDFAISMDGDIRYTGPPESGVTVLEFHRWLQEEMAKEDDGFGQPLFGQQDLGE